MISFYLNGKYHEISHLNPNTTVLEYLRLHEHQTDTKEGCGSGDCGACTIMAQRLPSHAMSDSSNSTPFYTFNACIALLSLMDGHHLMTASYLADNPAHHPERALLHPAQQAMVDCHGSQCGFCTPGFVMSLANLYENNRMQQQQNAKPSYDDPSYDDLSYDDIVAAISGNLCRCTGYRPIIEAGLTMGKIGQQRAADKTVAKDLTISLATDAMASKSKSLSKTESLDTSNQASTIEPALAEGSRQLFIPKTVDELNQLLAVYPSATIWAGGTDLGLSSTQHLVDHEVIIQLSAIDELRTWSLSNSKSSSKADSKSLSELDNPTDNETAVQELTFGAGMTYQQMLPILEHNFPAFAALFERTASPQIRNMGTLGGNIANASPIGDLPPILLALEARIHLRHCNPNNRDIGGEEVSAKDESNEHNQKPYVDEIIPLSEFFIDYKKTKLRAGSYIVAIHMPLMQANQHLFIHKISKRYEDDISACLVAVRIDLSADGMTIDHAKIGLGGMAAIPLLAKNCQQALLGQPLKLASFEKAAKALPMDVSPLTDVRASREYRLHVVQRLLIKCGKQLIKETQTERESS